MHVGVTPRDAQPNEHEVLRATIAQLRSDLTACKCSLSSGKRVFKQLARKRSRRKQMRPAATHTGRQTMPIDNERNVPMAPLPMHSRSLPASQALASSPHGSLSTSDGKRMTNRRQTVSALTDAAAAAVQCAPCVPAAPCYSTCCQSGVVSVDGPCRACTGAKGTCDACFPDSSCGGVYCDCRGIYADMRCMHVF